MAHAARLVRSTLAFLPLGMTIMCGGSETPSKSPDQAAQEAKGRELDALNAQEPKTPYTLDRTHAFQTGRECGQGPFRAEVPVLGAKYGERLDIYACTPRELVGRVRIRADGYVDSGDDGYAFGFGAADNARCKASETEIARAADAGGPATAAGPAARKGHAGTKGAKTEASQEPLAEDGSVSLAKGACPAGTHPEYMTSSEYLSSTGAKGKMHVEIWSAEPNDLRGVLFVLQQLRVDSSMTDTAWAKLQKDRDAWFARYEAFEKSHDDMFVHEDAGAGFAPPPPPKAEAQPPKPSVHAEWVPGYYRRNGASWAWIAGWWRVPDADVKAKLTVVAPTAPPAPREEAVARTEPAPAPEAVWAAGHWQWDGARWVWVSGGWRLPPRQGLTWQPPRWQSEARGFVFVPGGWGVRLR